MATFINFAIALALIMAGGVAIYGWRNDSAAASLAGALFGAAALFIGAEISRRDQKSRGEQDLLERRRRIRAALMPEVVSICVNHMSSATFFKLAAEALDEGNPPGAMDFQSHLPNEPQIYKAILSEITYLPEAEIDAITTFYHGIEITARALNQIQRTGNITSISVTALAGHFKHDCSVAARLVELVAPNRLIQREGGQPVSLVTVLKQAAGEA